MLSPAETGGPYIPAKSYGMKNLMSLVWKHRGWWLFPTLVLGAVSLILVLLAFTTGSKDYLQF